MRMAVAESVSRVICVPITLKIAQHIKSVVLMALFSRVQRIFNLQSRLVSLVVACKKITERMAVLGLTAYVSRRMLPVVNSCGMMPEEKRRGEKNI